MRALLPHPRAGLTLLELLVVIVIIAITTALVPLAWRTTRANDGSALDRLTQSAQREAIRRGDALRLQVGADGQLTTLDSRPVAGESGPLSVPPGSALVITNEGVVSAIGAGDPAVGAAEVGRLKLVNPPAADLVRGDDGLFRMRAGAAPAQADSTVRLLTGTLEGSNVNPVEVMVDMIANARRFEMHMKTLQTAESNDQQANKLLSNS